MPEENKKQSAPDPTGQHAKREEEILDLWKERNIFQKSLSQNKDSEEFVFYDGPPFATGMPHYGHILPGTIKDIIPRYQTMRGRHVLRRWGWDCHGLPVENEVEKELGLSTKKEIEEYGIDNFNEVAREAVLRYTDEWRKIIPRTGRFIDMDNDYRTMDPDYTESIWWSFKKLFDDELVYKGFKSMHLCPRCETTLSNFEVSQGYKDIKDISVTAKFKLKENLPSLSGMGIKAKVYVLAWTTTPWTLPGNVALAINKSIQYSVFRIKDTGEHVILAKDCQEKVMENTEYEHVADISAEELVGQKYEPVFSYYKESDLKNEKLAWQIYSADFVSTEEGTGIVHIAPAFGSDDLELAQREGLPMIQHVDKDGSFNQHVSDLANLQAKPKDDPTATDVEIIKLLAHQGKLFSKEKITHSYPHCWRCDTPLLNYASDSWFVAVKEFKDKLVSENKKINWVPDHVGSSRFGNWLLDARDWAVSRSRYWGAPLPVWVSEEVSGDSGEAAEMEVLSSREDLHKRAPDKVAKVFFMRHGESEKNVKGVFDSSRDTYPLTEKGRARASEAATRLADESIDIIVTSPVRRARETAEVVAEKIGCQIVEHEGLREVNSGEWEGKRPDDSSVADDVKRYHSLPDEKYYTAKRGSAGESWQEIERDVYKAVSEVIDNNPGKNILFTTHQGTMVYALKALHGWSVGYTRQNRLYDSGLVAHASENKVYVDTVRKKAFDFHRPYIDQITYQKNGKTMRRIEEVFDCWYESGAMPFASEGFSGQGDHPTHFPANFIAEGLDQTRGWFYSMLVLSNALFGQSAYQNVVVNGTILAEDGSKMSKRKKNYPDIMEVIDKYGADSLRYYLMSSPAVRGESVSFSEKGVEDVMKKVVVRLKNVVSFYEMYRPTDGEASQKVSKSKNILDLWIQSRLSEVINVVTDSLDNYELDKATRPLGEFVDDLSTWYLRRSRERMKGVYQTESVGGEIEQEDKLQALETLKIVLLNFSKLTAPFMPFVSEDVYGRLKGLKESVHLESWPEAGDVDQKVLDQMKSVREIISESLEIRSKEGIKVRQPLGEMRIKSSVPEEYHDIIKDEVNVKELVRSDDVEDSVELDTNLTDGLKREGVVREFLRSVQQLRKKESLNPEDIVKLTVSSDRDGKDLIEKNLEEITKTAGLSEIKFSDTNKGEVVSAHEYEFTIQIQ